VEKIKEVNESYEKNTSVKVSSFEYGKTAVIRWFLLLKR
jgi:hypothetical protein